MNMGVCRFCYKYTQLDNGPICKKCERKRKITYPERLCLSFRKGFLVPRNSQTHNILSKSEWYRVKHKIDGFYESITSDEIDDINENEEYKPATRSGYIYLMRSSNGYHKIGRSTNPITRRDNLMREYPIKIEVLFSVRVKNVVKAERRLLRAFVEKQLQGEWFNLDRKDVERFYSIVDKIVNPDKTIVTIEDEK